jgi:quinol-cytochrome oxidoreductase complex cytochrome b subunit
VDRTIGQRLFDWFDLRLDLHALIEMGRHKTVPAHRYSIFYYLGGATLFLFGVQVASGILLAMYYRASAEEACASVGYIMTAVPFGDLVRSVHAWSADLMIGFLFAHLFSVWIMRAYRAPRELTWVFGCFLLGVSVALGFTGYLLPWNELSYFATRVGTEIAGDVPLIGERLRTFLRGGEEITSLTLSRFFGFHIALLPGLATLLLLAHLLLVQRRGISVPERIEKRGGSGSIPFFPHGLLKDLIYWLLLLGLVVSLATFLPRELGLQADPFKPAPADIKPEWYFLFMFQALKLLPATIFGIEGETIGIVGFMGAFLFLLIMPFIDRKGRPFFTYAGWFALLFFIGFTIYGWID